MNDSYSIKVEDVNIVVSRQTGRTLDNRATFSWSLTHETGKQIGSGAHLNSGVSQNPSARDMMPSLLGFLGACAESRKYGSPDSENWNLFAEPIAEWAAQNSDELAMAELELEEQQS